MASVKLSDEALLAFLESYSDIRDRVASIASAVGNLDGDCRGGRGRGTACRGDAAFGPRGVARLGGRAGANQSCAIRRRRVVRLLAG
jgi:hypothetical protein